MYNAFWRLALFVRGQSFSFKTFDRSRNGCQVIREGAGNNFRGPSVQALPLPSRVSFSRARFFLNTLTVSPVFFCLFCISLLVNLQGRTQEYLLAREILLREQRRTYHKRVTKTNYIFEYPWNLV